MFPIPPNDLLDKLSKARQERGIEPDDIERKFSGFILDPGLGPAVYLAADGRVVWDGWYEWTEAAPTIRNAYMSVVVGASKTGVTDLLKLLPPRPPDAIDCSACGTTGWTDLVDADGKPFQIVCHKCAGLGWMTRLTGVVTELVQALVDGDLEDRFEQREWATKHRALPISADMSGCFVLTLEGAVMSFAWDHPSELRAEDERISRVMLYQGSLAYPALRPFVPERPGDAIECASCAGTGKCRDLPDELAESVVCYCGGLGWLRPGR